ncbi:MAG: zinc ribbon domain-containing protein [Methanomicrobiales archaeon]
MVTITDIEKELSELYNKKKLTRREYLRLKKLFGLNKKRKENPYEWLSEPLERLYKEGKITNEEYKRGKQIFQIKHISKKRKITQFCDKCGKEIPMNVKHCLFCGYKLPKNKFCHECGEKVNPEIKYCPYCGAKQNP